MAEPTKASKLSKTDGPTDATPNVSDVETVEAATETEAVAAIEAPVERGEPILQVRNLVKHFPLTQGILFKRQIGAVKAVDGVSFDLYQGETLG
ncbi:peptide ABC transporter ATP-binding protein, partial [Streptomyces venezuelae]